MNPVLKAAELRPGPERAQPGGVGGADREVGGVGREWQPSEGSRCGRTCPGAAGHVHVRQDMSTCGFRNSPLASPQVMYFRGITGSREIR